MKEPAAGRGTPNIWLTVKKKKRKEKAGQEELYISCSEEKKGVLLHSAQTTSGLTRKANGRTLKLKDTTVKMSRDLAH